MEEYSDEEFETVSHQMGMIRIAKVRYCSFIILTNAGSTTNYGYQFTEIILEPWSYS